ncbi:hypothetical protein [Streptomyces sp. NPDC058683]|uniref:hypothetical protein n=1 Tax=Streptomyces sp. NPDC058683 TaxID=3346597 RepID=UPI00364E0CD8
MRIQSPQGRFLSRRDADATGEHVDGLLVLDIRLPEEMNDTGLTWQEIVNAMNREEEWTLDVVGDRPLTGTTHLSPDAVSVRALSKVVRGAAGR